MSAVLDVGDSLLMGRKGDNLPFVQPLLKAALLLTHRQGARSIDRFAFAATRYKYANAKRHFLQRHSVFCLVRARTSHISIMGSRFFDIASPCFT